METTIMRAATVADADEVAAIYIASRRRDVSFAPLVHSDEEIRRWLGQVLILRGRVIVIQQSDRIAAMMAVSGSANGSWIDHLYVHPDLMSRGFGTTLLNHAKQSLPPPVQLYTFQQNQRARDFYECHGFVAVAFSDGRKNDERCADVLYQWREKP
jgi:ribosomal protein S18 acetylase RimI-like enzyme